MGLFGGDPRFVRLEVLYRMNMWYDIVFLPALLFVRLRSPAELTTKIIVWTFLVAEIARMGLHRSHWNGDIPLYVLFVIVSVLPTLLLAVVWILLIDTPFDMACMLGYITLLIAELGHVPMVYKSLRLYQDGFYQFARGRAYAETGRFVLDEVA